MGFYEGNNSFGRGQLTCGKDQASNCYSHSKMCTCTLHVHVAKVHVHTLIYILCPTQQNIAYFFVWQHTKLCMLNSTDILNKSLRIWHEEGIENVIRCLCYSANTLKLLIFFYYLLFFSKDKDVHCTCKVHRSFKVYTLFKDHKHVVFNKMLTSW